MIKGLSKDKLYLNGADVQKGGNITSLKKMFLLYFTAFTKILCSVIFKIDYHIRTCIRTKCNIETAENSELRIRFQLDPDIMVGSGSVCEFGF